METFFTRKDYLNLMNQYWMTWKKLRKRTVKNSPDQITFIQEFKAVELGNCHDVWCTASTDEVLEEWKVAVWHQSLTRAPCFWWNHRHNSQQRREWIVNMLYVSTWLLFQKVCRDRVVSGQRIRGSSGQFITFQKNVAAVLLTECLSALSVWKERFPQGLLTA